jgi:hypothetical protein
MYQTLIWPSVLGHDARRLGAALDAEDLEGLADALVDGVRRNVQLGGDFLGREMLVHEAQAVELTRRQPGHTLRHGIVVRRALMSIGRVRQTRRLLQSKTHPARHVGTPRATSPLATLFHIRLNDQFSADFWDLWLHRCQ